MRLDNPTIKRNLKKCLGLDAKTSKIVVVGLGATGISVIRYLKSLEFDFSVVDSREQPSVSGDDRAVLENVQIITGRFDKELLNAATHLVVSPGISLKEKAIAEAIDKGVRVLGDIDLFACSVEMPIVAITGSNGKSTVTTLLGEMAKSAKQQAGVGGNLGVPALDLLLTPADLYVLELSSFQLERTTCLKASAATVLNVSADHLDRHESVIDYANQKQRIFRGKGAMVLNIDDPLVLAMQEKGRRTYTFSITQPADFCIAEIKGTEYLLHGGKKLFPLTDLPLEGRHNAANALAALALGMAIGLNEKKMCKALKNFKGLPHRMQRIAKIKGITWINDSKATNIGACVAALSGYARQVILIAGGDAKGADMKDLVPVIKTKVKSIILMGKDAELIEHALNGCVPVYQAKSMEEAVSIAAKLAASGDSVLLSPACASLDQYKNYQERGDKFAEAVMRLAA